MKLTHSRLFLNLTVKIDIIKSRFKNEIISGVNRVLTDEVMVLNGIGEKVAADLKTMQIETVEDLLYHFPSRYEMREVKPLQELIHDDQVTIVGKMLYEPTVSFFGRKKSRMVFTVMVDEVAIKAVMFNRSFAKKQLQQEMTVTLTGKWDAHRLQITVQHYQLGEPSSEETIQVFYSIKGNVTNARIKGAVKQAIHEYLTQVEEILPEVYLTDYKIPSRQEAIKQLHLPDGKEALKHARRRFVYEELLLFQLKMQSLKYRQKLQQGGVIQEIEHDALEGFIHSLPYKLTTAQDRVLQDIFKDMTSPVQMNRLLQGDVGS